MTVKEDEVRGAVRARYARIAASEAREGCGCSTSCCGGEDKPSESAVKASSEAGCGCATGCCSEGHEAKGVSQAVGYSAAELAALPEGADMGLGCGNPRALASLRPGETVVDLGSGGGIDCFLAAKAVGPEGRVIGVDMTPEMVSKARKNAEKAGYGNVEFRLGEIEHLPVADGAADVVISNCVINLSPHKLQAYREAFRALRPGGRLAVSDMVSTAALPPDVQKDLEAFTGCLAGASDIGAVRAMLDEAGFQDVRVEPKESAGAFIREWVPGSRLEDYVRSASITARKP